MRTTPILLALAAIGAWSLFGWFAEGRESPTIAVGADSNGNGKPASAVGAAGCAANGCHGNVAADVPAVPFGPLAERAQSPDCWKTSFLQWANLDKHARAYEVLKDNRSIRIVRNLKKLSADSKLDGTKLPECLACHANPTLANKQDPVSLRLQQEGVGCEACHGNAEFYRSRHTAWTADANRNREYDAVGMNRLFDPFVRAETCAGCHVGAPPAEGVPLRDVHHDLIAAGHPRLNFDYAAYLRRMPAHWQERDRTTGKPRSPGFEGDFWAIGQNASAEAALRLLRDRFATRDETHRWPELAEFNCYSCHHDLQPANWRPKKAAVDPLFGFLDWNQPGLTADKSAVAGKLNDVRTALNEVLKGKKEPAKLVEAIDDALKSIEETKGAASFDVGKLALTPGDLAKLDWDQASRMYQALVAATNSRRQREPQWAGADQAETYRKGVFEKLHFSRPDRNAAQKKWLDSPADYSPDAVRQTLDDWQKLLSR